MRTFRLAVAVTAVAALLATIAVVAFAAPAAVVRSAAPMAPTIAQYGGGVAPDLKIALSLNPSVVVTGDGVLLNVTVRNKPERGGADGVTVTIDVPDALEVTSTKSNRGPGKCTGTTQLRCFLDFMSPIHVGVIDVNLRTKAAGSATIAARVTSAQKDENPADNSGSTVLTVRAPAPPPTGGGTTPSTAGRTIAGTSRADTIVGTAKNDRLSGLGGNDQLFGRGGNDRLLGGAGNDVLNGGPGRDAILGGPGNDTILARDRARDTIACGTGRDTVQADRIDVVARDCERVTRR